MVTIGVNMELQLQVTPAEWAAIEAAGSGVLFREGEPVSWSDENGWADRPPAEFVEAAQPWCPADTDGDGDCALCARKPGIHGKRRVAVVVPCWCACHRGIVSLTSAVRDCPCWVRMTAPSGYEQPGETPDVDAWIPQCGLVTVGHVVVTWGPRRLVARADRMEPGALLDVAVVMDRVLSFVTDRGTVATIPHSPDIDPQSLVGQYAIGVKVAA